MRVVFALRSVEIKPLFRRFVVSFSQEKKHFSPLSFHFFLLLFSFFFFFEVVATAGSEDGWMDGCGQVPSKRMNRGPSLVWFGFGVEKKRKKATKSIL